MKVELAGPIWGRRDQNPPGANTGWTDTGWSEMPSQSRERGTPTGLSCRSQNTPGAKGLSGVFWFARNTSA